MTQKRDLRRLIDQLKQKKFRDTEAKGISDSIGEDLKKQFGPAVNDAIERGLAQIKIPETKIPETKIPEPIVNVAPTPVNLPAPIVNVPAPIVNVPAPVVNIPETIIPDFPSEFSLKGVNRLTPLPVMMMDDKGRPAQFGNGGTTATGGRGDFFTIKDIQNSTGGSIIDNATGYVNVRLPEGLSLSASNASTQLIDSSANAVGTAANPLNVAITSGAASSTFAQVGNSDGTFSAANPLPVTFTGSSSTSVSLVNADGTYYNSANPLPVSVSGAAGTSASAIVDSTGVQYSGSNPFPVTFSAAASQNVNLFDAQASAVTSHQDSTGDFRGIDTSLLTVVNVESALNSTTATLGIGGIFTGLAEDVSRYAQISILVFADQASATDGLSVQQSMNGTNWDLTDTYTVPASNGKFFSFQPASRYFRIVYTNGGTGQTAFRMSTFHHLIPTKASSQRAADAYTNETDLEQVWAFAAAFNGTTWDRLRNTAGEGNALRVQFANDAVASVNLVADNVSLEVIQVSGASNSVNVVGPIDQGDEATALRVVHAGNAASSVATQATGLNETTAGVLRAVLMTDSLNSVNNVQWGGSAVATGLNEVTNGVVRVYPMTSANSSVFITGSSGTTVIVGDIASDVADTGGNPVKIGGIARTANPTAVAAGDRVSLTMDTLGRPIMRPFQVRALTKTAYVSLSSGAETTLLAGTTSAPNDMVMIAATNASSAAFTIDVRSGTAGSILHTMVIPANTGPIGFAPPLPYPGEAGSAWTVDLQGTDISNPNVSVTGIFVQDV